MRFDAPFPHVVIDQFVEPEVVREINAQWPTEWQQEDKAHARKLSGSSIPPAARTLINWIEPAAVGFMTGIDGLQADPDLFGAGLHCIPPGGFLKMHVDFNRHPKGWHRRVNLLLYLNEGWQDEWGGHLQLGLGAEARRIAPVAGRCVIFPTTDESWHGHPEPLACPPDVQRRSLALYFYTPEPPRKRHNTIYRQEAA